MTPDKKPWFAPKRYGFGSGPPITWEGWAVLIGYIAVVLVLPSLLPLVPRIAIIVVATCGLWWLSATRTAGGWRWRNGKD